MRPGIFLATGLIVGMALPPVAAQGTPPGSTNAPAVAPGTDFTHLELDELLAIRIPVVYGAAKHEQKSTDAPASVSVVTREDIQDYGYRTMGDLLNGVRGFYTIFDRGYYFLGGRGVNRLGDFGGRTLTLVDGHRLNDPIYENTSLGYDFPLDLDLIERVEVIRGAGSALYGNNAFFDVINIVTRTPADFSGRGVEAATSYGSFDTYTGRFTYGQTSTNGLETLVSGSYVTSTGNPILNYPAAPALGFPGATQRGGDDQTARNILLSVAYNGFSLQGLYGLRTAGLANGPYGAVFNDPRNTSADERSYLEARYHREFAPDWKVEVRAYADHYAYDGSYAYPTPAGVVQNREAPRANWTGGELQLGGPLGENHRLTFGVEGRWDLQQSLLNYDVVPYHLYLQENHTPVTFGAYVQEEYHFAPPLTLDAGLRYDYFSSFGATVNPRLGLLYHPLTDTTFKALFGQAYRTPNADEFHYHDLANDANPGLHPETVRSYELVAEQGFARHYRITGTLFYEDVEDLITQTINPADGNSIFENVSRVSVRGAEAELEGRWAFGLRARASYAYALAVDDQTGQRLANSPRHLAKLQLTAPLYPPKVNLGLEVLGASAVQSAAGDRVPGRVVVNLTLNARDLIHNLDVSLGIANLLNQQFYDPVAPGFAQDLIPLDGRTFRLKATYRF